MEKLLTTKEAGVLIGCSSIQVRIFIELGMLKALRIGHGWRIRPSVLETFVETYEGYDISTPERALQAKAKVEGMKKNERD